MYSRIKNFINNSLFANNIDNILYMIMLLILSSAVCLKSDYMGALALLFSILTIFKSIFIRTKEKFKFRNYHKAILIFFLIVTLSLFGSTLFSLSFHGYIKTFIYILFFYCSSIFFKDNKNKITPTILFVSFLMSTESIIAIIQNNTGVLEISGWQDTTSINPEEVVSRAYGTLQPYNPNLLAGYLLCGLSSFVYLILNFLSKNKKKIALLFSILFLINLIAIIDTGCRGAYLGFLFFFPCLFLAIIYYVQKKFGGISNIKKRYKNITLAGVIGILFFIFTNPALIKRFESILAFREDSSISFRLNVYESAIKMFLDNPFLGIGVGNQNFREIYGLYMKTGFDALGSYCVPLEIAVESGIFALIAFILFLFLVVKFCLETGLKKAPKEEIGTKDRILCLGIILMILATMGHGLFDTIWFRPQVQLLFWINISMLSALKIKIK